MFRPGHLWPAIHQFLTTGVPQPPRAAEETPEVIEGYVQRIQAGFGVLRQQLEEYRPDAVVIVGDDQNEVFSGACIPAMAMYLGEQVSGTTNIGFLRESLEGNHITLTCHSKLSRYILERLIERGFDVAFVEKLTPLARPAGGLGHAFIRPANVLKLHEDKIPVVVFFLNAYHRPLPSAARCYELGQAIAQLLADRPERVAILGSGGLSHDPGGPRAGWVDEPLDRWVLDRISSGDGEALKQLFTFDSDTLRGGTGEIRSWITVAGGMAGTKATVVEYIPASHTTVGLGMAYWKATAA